MAKTAPNPMAAKTKAKAKAKATAKASSSGLVPLHDPHNAFKHVLSRWAAELRRDDPVVWQFACEDVHNYLYHCLMRNLQDQTKAGRAGWAFRSAQMSDFVRAAIWGDGSSSRNQCLPLGAGGPAYGEKWWPCLVLSTEAAARLGYPADLSSDPPCSALVPFYCPVLAKNRARAWASHHSRLREVVIVETPGPIITELESSDDEDDASNTSGDPFNEDDASSTSASASWQQVAETLVEAFDDFEICD